MYNFLVKNGTAVAMIVGSVLTLLFIVTTFMGLSSAGYDTSSDLLLGDYKSITAFNFGLTISVFLSILALIIMLLAIILDLIKNRKTSGKMILGVVALFVIFFVLYTTATFDVGGKWDTLNAEFGVGEGASKFITAGIWTTGVLMVVSILAILVSEVRNFFR